MRNMDNEKYWVLALKKDFFSGYKQTTYTKILNYNELWIVLSTKLTWTQILPYQLTELNYENFGIEFAVNHIKKGVFTKKYIDYGKLHIEISIMSHVLLINIWNI